jgi:hypothetical protein
LGSVGEWLLECGMSKQTGDELVSEFAESQMDLGLQGSEGSRIACQLFGPEGLLVRQMGLNQGEGLVRRRDGGSGWGVEVEAHGKSFRVKLYLLG